MYPPWKYALICYNFQQYYHFQTTGKGTKYRPAKGNFSLHENYFCSPVGTCNSSEKLQVYSINTQENLQS